MELGPSTSRSCRVRDCGYSPVTEGHGRCPVHSPCFSRGRYLPEACETCSAWVIELRTTPMDQVQQLPAWGALRNHLIRLRQATLGLSPCPDLRAPEEFAKRFPSVFQGTPVNSPSESVRPPSESRTPPLPPTPVDDPTGLALSSRMSKLEAGLLSLQETVAALVEAVSQGGLRPGGPSDEDLIPPPSKRARLSSPSRRDWFAPSPAAPSDIASTSGDVEEGSGSGDGVSVAGAGDLPPSASLGWKKKPDDWVVKPGGDELEGFCLDSKGKLKPMPELEFRLHSVGGVPKYY